MKSTDRFVEWIFWKILLPFALVGIFWPIYRWVLELKFPFERAFAHGDLLLLSALLLMEAAVEGDEVLGSSAFIRIARNVARVIAVLLFVGFGFIKYDVILNEERMAVASQSEAAQAVVKIVAKLTNYAYLNLGITGIAILYSIATFSGCLMAQRKLALQRIKGEVTE